jgi:hypothetical protein
MDVANRFPDGEDAYQNKRTRSPEDDRSNRYSNQRRRSRNYDNYGSHSQVAAGYKENNYQRDDRRNSRYCNDSRDNMKEHFLVKSNFGCLLSILKYLTTLSQSCLSFR